MPLSDGIQLNEPQGEFIASTTPFRGYVGGYRAGKTFVGCFRLWTLAVNYPGIKLGYFAPTYPQITDIFYDTIAEVGEAFSHHVGVQCWVDINVSSKTAKLMVGRKCYATVKCRSMEHAHRIVGFDISHALVDEIDTMKKAKADAAWKKIVARMSSVRDDYKVNTVDFTTTPEGFNWMYDFFVKQLREKPEMQKYYSLVKASTLKNAKNLPDDYIDKLYATYPGNLVDAYVNGDFVNLTSGTVYPQFDRHLNNSNEQYQQGESIYIGMDFNVGRMCAVVYVLRNGKPHAVDEFINAYDTPEMIRLIKRKYWREISEGEFEKLNAIYVYPDSSGKNRKSVGASETDISLLKNAGFTVRAKSTNPPIKDRVNSMNAAFCNSKGERTLFINTKLCPHYTEKLEQQVYNDRGEPEKDGTEDVNDAGGYYIAYEYPIIKPMWTGGLKMR